MKKLLTLAIAFVLSLCGILSFAQNIPNTQNTASIVYMTKDISPQGLAAVYAALECTPSGNVAVKISTGEPGGNNFLSPTLIKDFVLLLNGTIVERAEEHQQTPTGQWQRPMVLTLHHLTSLMQTAPSA